MTQSRFIVAGVTELAKIEFEVLVKIVQAYKIDITTNLDTNNQDELGWRFADELASLVSSESYRIPWDKLQRIGLIDLAADSAGNWDIRASTQVRTIVKTYIKEDALTITNRIKLELFLAGQPMPKLEGLSKELLNLICASETRLYNDDDDYDDDDYDDDDDEFSEFKFKGFTLANLYQRKEQELLTSLKRQFKEETEFLLRYGLIVVDTDNIVTITSIGKEAIQNQWGKQ